MVSPAIIGVGFVVLVLVALGIAYYMGYFGDSEEDDSALDAMIESSSAAPASSSTLAASAPASSSSSALASSAAQASSSSAASSAAQASSSVAASSAAVSSSVLNCEEGQLESNGECIPIPFVAGPVFDASITYPIHNGSADNYYNYCIYGLNQGYCTTSGTFPNACRDECNRA